MSRMAPLPARWSTRQKGKQILRRKDADAPSGPKGVTNTGIPYEELCQGGEVLLRYHVTRYCTVRCHGDSSLMTLGWCLAEVGASLLKSRVGAALPPLGSFCRNFKFRAWSFFIARWGSSPFAQRLSSSVNKPIEPLSTLKLWSFRIIS